MQESTDFSALYLVYS